jgi:hypothetical protein
VLTSFGIGVDTCFVVVFVVVGVDGADVDVVELVAVVDDVVVLIGVDCKVVVFVVLSLWLLLLSFVSEFETVVDVDVVAIVVVAGVLVVALVVVACDVSSNSSLRAVALCLADFGDGAINSESHELITTTTTTSVVENDERAAGETKNSAI